jgi:hypothetical protein
MQNRNQTERGSTEKAIVMKRLIFNIGVSFLNLGPSGTATGSHREENGESLPKA